MHLTKSTFSLRRGLFLLLGALLAASPPGAATAGVLLVEGSMDSQVRISYEQSVTFPDQAGLLKADFVVPTSFASATFRQDVSDHVLEFDPLPQAHERAIDPRGNSVITATWKNPPREVRMRASFTVVTGTGLSTVRTDAPFPPGPPSREAAPYLRPSVDVQSGAPQIVALAARLAEGAKSQAEAVRRVILHTASALRYVNPPPAYDALYSLRTGTGNCQNYSHLAAALLRAMRIPARIVTGFTLSRPFDVPWPRGVYTMKFADGPHSWIEVWFPDLGWVPFDPQKTAFFVASRFVRIESGLDNEETRTDGRLLWRRPAQSRPPVIRTNMTGEFSRDEVKLAGLSMENVGEQLVLQPRVAAAMSGLAGQPEIPAVQPPPKAAPAPRPESAPEPKSEPLPIQSSRPPKAPQPEPKVAPVTPPATVPPPPPAKPERTPEPARRAPARPVRLVFGNTEFPVNVDFASHAALRDLGHGETLALRDYLVESAEYVTTRQRQFAQAFAVDKDMLLSSASLGLHRFGGEGALWLELRRDEDGSPGGVVAVSGLVEADTLAERPGYRWQPFDFGKGVDLDPGVWWLALGWSGDPVVNWFYTYGRPVGPLFGTRWRNALDGDAAPWSGALGFEFTYKIEGKTIPASGS